ncbi:hypothetical protein BDZ94DRAFT_1165954 [Collybia nuda]|uniref:Uncharacterized protein n=1 Tax=Collybia nuda TaxID=64659 RepID=A0A9P5Y382_9AGAR|nr:hypothetical protein BDZ94DRAFT_1165954 [Collybia nuda]
MQLIGVDGSTVRATGQVDDGAMRNCISKQRWDAYGHCLSALKQSKTVIGVANNAKIKSMGTWTGPVKVSNTETVSNFEVFDCQGAFDIILGKPWLWDVRAIHDY